MPMRRWVITLALCLLPVVAWAQCSPQNPTACGGTTLNTLTLGSQINLGTWTTSGRPLNPATGATGFNTTTGLAETWNGSAWVASGGGVAGPGSTTSGYIPTWGNTSGTSLGAGIPTTGNGNAVLSTSPSLTTPALGTPTSLTLTNATGLPNSGLINNTISGIGLGSNLNALTFGPHLSAGGSSYNGTTNITITSDATNANTASTIVARDSGGNFSAGTITAGLTGHASLDCALAGCTYTGTNTYADGGTWSASGISVTGANVTGAAGFQQYGTNAYNQGVATVHTPMFIGPGAGHSYPLSSTGSAWTLGVGFNALYSLSIDAENIAIGSDTGESATTAQDMTAIGVHAVGQETTQGNIVAVGDDAFRNSIGSGNSIGLGSSTLRNGAQPFDVAIGTQALHGNSSTLTLGGTATNGDTIAVTVTAGGTGTLGSPIVNLGTTVPCAITTSESLASMTTCLQTAITNLGVTDTYWAMGASAAAASGGPTNIISLDFPGSHTTGWQLKFPPVITGSATETITVEPGSLSSSTIAIGEEACSGFYTFNSGSGNNICIGPNVMPFYTTAQQGIVIGGSGNLGSAAFNIKNDSAFVFLGAGAGYSSTGEAGNTCIGFNGCAGAVSGGKNSTLGWEDSSGYNCITTGGGNLELGADACVASATASWQLSIQNAIYGTNNSGQGVASTGQIGIETSPIGSYTSVALGGEVIIGSGSALATAATAGFLHLPFTTAAPTGTPANIVGNSCEINTATESLNCYIGAAWYHVALTSGAN